MTHPLPHYPGRQGPGALTPSSSIPLSVLCYRLFSLIFISGIIFLFRGKDDYARVSSVRIHASICVC